MSPPPPPPSSSKKLMKDLLTTCGCVQNAAADVAAVQPKPKRKPPSSAVDSVAVVKVSDDPYKDFRQSMLQMILEREIYSRNDLQQLLECFLQLNSAHHHPLILRAFAEISDALHKPSSSTSSAV